MFIEEQEKVLKNEKKNMIVSASAGSGKTYVLIQYICRLVCEKRVPIKKLLILTFTKAAATEMKERLLKALKEQKMDDFILKQIDDLSVSNISTIHSFCEYCLKKYANILKLNENFEIADENVSRKLKISALKNVLNKFKENREDAFAINYAFKNDIRKIRESIFLIESMVASVSNKQEFIAKVRTCQGELFAEAEKIVCEYVDSQIKSDINLLEKRHFNDIAFEIERKLQIENQKDLLNKIEVLQNFSFPTLPKKTEITEEELSFLKEIRKDFAELNKKLSSLSLDEERVEEEKKGELEKALIKLYVKYEEEYKRLKLNSNVLDFSDLEQYMLSLSKEKLFNENYEFVFIDEYQDTNSLQEKIVKKVAENSNFVAVGDAKQGIYGFRLASSKIFLKDVEEFNENESSNAVFLKSNFRSSKKVLDFINDIFKDAMTVETAGIDYLNTSMLSYKKEYLDDGEFAVNVDVVEKEEKERKKFDIYSVKEDEIIEDINYNELNTIKARIEEILKSKIFDPEINDFRQVEFKDIAIISRSRNNFFNVLANFLNENNIPVNSNSKNLLLENPEIQILLNILKLTLVFNDDVALLSVLMSNFGKFNQDEIYDIVKGSEKTLTQIVLENEKGIFDEFLKNLSIFKTNGLTYGYKQAFEILFDDTLYYPYIFSQPDAEWVNASLKLFLEEIEKSGFKFDLPALISYFENVDIEDAGVSSSENNAIILTTIHKTKGLEYPIVMLINAGKSLKKAGKNTEIKVDEELGVVVKHYEDDHEDNTVKMLATELKNAKKTFAEEMMIFYVALTRAKNRLYIIGERPRENLKPLSVFKIDSYLDYIFNTLSQDEIETFLSKEELIKGNVKFNHITEVENIKLEKNQKKYGKINEKIVKNIENYLNFEYLYKTEENISFKNSVTALTKQFEDNNIFLPNFEMVNTNSNVVEVGNAYHLALKIIDFNKVEKIEDLLPYFKNNINLASTESLIDKKLLFENILTLKPFAKYKVFKEQEFVMKDTIKNLINFNFDDNIMVQGVVDFFAFKENGRIVLIDYKYSKEQRQEVLVNRYKLQLKLYKNAIESGLNVKVDEIYLLNLRYNKLIKIDNFE